MRASKLVALVLGPAMMVAWLLVPPLPGMLDVVREHGVSLLSLKLSLGVLFWVSVWWISEVVPLAVTALLPALLLPMAGVISWKSSLTSFASGIIWVFIGGFTLAKAFRVWGLDKRVALKLASLYRGGSPALTTFFVACLPVFLLTITGSITASTSLVYPIVLSYLSSMGFLSDERYRGYSEATMLSLGQAATAGAMFLLISTPPNLVAKSVIEESVPGVTLTFFDWFIVGTPQAIAGLLISWLTVFAVLRPKCGSLAISDEFIASELRRLGRLRRGEKLVLATFAVALVLWSLPGLVMIASNVDPSLAPLSELVSRALPEAAPAVIVVLLLTLMRAEGRPLLTWRELEEGIDWGVVFLMGGGIALGRGLSASGFPQWISTLLLRYVAWRPDLWSICALSALIGFLVTYPASNTASSIIACPLAAYISMSYGYNPIPAVVAAGLACSISSALPSTTPPMAIIYGSKCIRLWNMFKVGMVSDIIRLAFLVLTAPHLSLLLCQVKGVPLRLRP